MKFLLIALTSIFTILGQIILKLGQSTLYWPQALSLTEMARLFWYSITNWYVLLSFFSTTIAAVTWLLTVQVVPLSRAYPFMGINYVVVYFLSLFMFGERLNVYSVWGMLLVVLGTILLGLGLGK